MFCQNSPHLLVPPVQLNFLIQRLVYQDEQGTIDKYHIFFIFPPEKWGGGGGIGKKKTREKITIEKELKKAQQEKTSVEADKKVQKGKN